MAFTSKKLAAELIKLRHIDKENKTLLKANKQYIAQITSLEV